jgi:hypothetical protein
LGEEGTMEEEEGGPSLEATVSIDSGRLEEVMMQQSVVWLGWMVDGGFVRQIDQYCENIHQLWKTPWQLKMEM